MSDDGLPVLPHIAGEFYVWLWWASEIQSAQFHLDDPVGIIDLWVDERLAFRIVGETKVTAVMTGEASSTSLEARAALAGGKILQEIRIFLRRDDREFSVTLKGPEMHSTAVKLPNSLRRLRMTISAIAYSGKWLTMMNITVPASMTMKL